MEVVEWEPIAQAFALSCGQPQGSRLGSCHVVCGGFTNPRISSPSVVIAASPIHQRRRLRPVPGLPARTFLCLRLASNRRTRTGKPNITSKRDLCTYGDKARRGISDVGGRSCCVFGGRAQCASRESSLKNGRQWSVAVARLRDGDDTISITMPEPQPARPTAFGMKALAKSLQLKNLLINRWGSIACGENIRNPMILKNRGGGGG